MADCCVVDSSELVDVPEDASVMVDKPVLPVLVVVDVVVSEVLEEVDGAAVVATGAVVAGDVVAGAVVVGAVVAGDVVTGAVVVGAVVADVAVSEVDDVADAAVVDVPVLPGVLFVPVPVVGLFVTSIHVPVDAAGVVSDEPEHGASALSVTPQVLDVGWVESPVVPVGARCSHCAESSSEEDDEAVDVDSDDDNEGVSGTSSEGDAAATNLGADVISNDSDADECDTEADEPRAAQTIVV
ncbi:hypothetical protein PInf_021941 [Phytophthora infestans]|nr:hypothetical protein PInf_021941 [Phytophthora infestans]